MSQMFEDRTRTLQRFTSSVTEFFIKIRGHDEPVFECEALAFKLPNDEWLLKRERNGAFCVWNRSGTCQVVVAGGKALPMPRSEQADEDVRVTDRSLRTSLGAFQSLVEQAEMRMQGRIEPLPVFRGTPVSQADYAITLLMKQEKIKLFEIRD